MLAACEEIITIDLCIADKILEFRNFSDRGRHLTDNCRPMQS